MIEERCVRLALLNTELTSTLRGYPSGTANSHDGGRR
jgi:hypothetical protein